MEIDIYGDLDNLDNEYEKVQKENIHLKETVSRLEEIAEKFSKEIAELKRINSDLEVKISSLYKTAKAEIERKNRQISDLTKDLDNMVFKRSSHKNVINKKENNSQQNEFLSKQYEDTQHILEQKNRIIYTLNSELVTLRKELAEKSNSLKRDSSQIEETNDYHYTIPKKQKLEKETYVENEEEYRRYKQRFENRDRKSPDYSRYNYRRNDDLRSHVDLKRIRYPNNRLRGVYKYNKRFSRNDYMPYYKQRARSRSPLDYNNYNFNTEYEKLDEKNYNADLKEYNDYESETHIPVTENVNKRDNSKYSHSLISNREMKHELEDGEVNNDRIDFNRKFKNTNSKTNTVLKESKIDYLKKKNSSVELDDSRETNIKIELNVDKTLSKNNEEKNKACEFKNLQTNRIFENSYIELKQVNQEQDNKPNYTDYANAESSELLKIKSEILEALQNSDTHCNDFVEKSEIPDKLCLESNKNINYDLTKIKKQNIETSASKCDDKVTKTKCKKADKKKCEKIKAVENSELSHVKQKITNVENSSKVKTKMKTDSVKSSKNSTNDLKKQTKKSAEETKVIQQDPKSLPVSKSKTKCEKTNSQTNKIVDDINLNKYETKTENFENKIIETEKSKIKREDFEKSLSGLADSNISLVTEKQSISNKDKNQHSDSANIKMLLGSKPSGNANNAKISKLDETNICLVSDLNFKKSEVCKISESIDTNILLVSEMSHTNTENCDVDNIDKNISAILKTDADEFSISLVKETKIISNKNNSLPILQNCTTTVKQNESTSCESSRSSSSNAITEEKPLSAIESQNDSVTQDRKPPLRGRRRRCVISIT